MQELLTQIQNCTLCSAHLEPRPVMSASIKSRIAIIGQAPGSKVHQSGVPWNDASGRLLRQWLGVDDDTFYNPDKIALIPMGFCYPGKGSSGDLPPRPECAQTWHQSLLDQMTELKLTILIGQYAQGYYLKERKSRNLTETVRNAQSYLPDYLPLPHPSPRNRFWIKKNPWFEEEVLSILQESVSTLIK